ncbi:bactofilin family protein [Spirochaeta africana]|uniref:Integral membrane protein CcmA involved in cell shape determination n=1 Tax=Spirochaeta africana (strain ATCC 700263 / DSM 8902 / Z-7692) TaxID=889378 RepID=H9UKF8_SPIAZ|nr:polymer-forming cytoskeletal protein [Spirochaeta africana]AFG38001.1 Integral membrane protein CcmA involved in cell shape determination [Spirochaeta africana DSM 8902]
MGHETDELVINSLVGTGSFFRGDINTRGLLRIDGDYAGSIKTTGKILIGMNGRAECEVQAATVVIGGAVRGVIEASQKVILLSSAVVIGDIYAPRLVAEEGVLIDGLMQISGVPMEMRITPEQYRKKRGLFGWLRGGDEAPAEETLEDLKSQVR